MAVTTRRKTSTIATGWRRSRFTRRFPACRVGWKLVVGGPGRDDSSLLRDMSRFAELSALVLDPLRGRSDAEWERGPAGKWTPAQIVEHLALGLTLSADTFQKRRTHAPM